MLIDPDAFNHVTGPTLAAAIEVHRTLGPGLLESIYMPCFKYELTLRKLRFVAHHPIPIVYKGLALDANYEVKSAAALLPVHESQTLTYMKLAQCPIGLLINFNAPRLVDGVRRLIRPVKT